MNDDDDWVICSNRQDAELDADIRSGFLPIGESMISLYLYKHLLSDACQNIWNGNEPIGVIGEKRPNQWIVPESF